MTRGKYIRTNEIKNKQSLKMKGHPTSDYQKQVVKKLMLSSKNPMYDPETRAKQLESTNTQEFKKKHSDAILGNKNPMKNPKVAKLCRGFKKHHHTNKNKKILSDKKKEFYKSHPELKRNGEKSNFYGKCGKLSSRYGKQTPHSKKTFLHYTPFQGQIKMHRWEHIYAEYLDLNNIKYYYEPICYELNIDGRDTTYTPDFYLPEFLEYIEVKGYWRDDASTKSVEFEQNLPFPFRYNILYKKDLQNLGIIIK